MARKGYNEEYKVKKKLIELYGKDAVFKLAIGEAFDYLVLAKDDKIEKLVEVKGTHDKKKYFNKRERAQIERINTTAKPRGIRTEVWVVKPREEIEIIVTNKGKDDE